MKVRVSVEVRHRRAEVLNRKAAASEDLAVERHRASTRSTATRRAGTATAAAAAAGTAAAAAAVPDPSSPVATAAAAAAPELAPPAKRVRRGSASNS